MTPLEGKNRLLQFFSLRRELKVRDVRPFPFIAGIAIICASTFSRDCYPLMLTAVFCSLPVTVYSLTTIIFYVSR